MLLRKETDISHVALSGGVSQNSILLENAFYKLRDRGFIPLPMTEGYLSARQSTVISFNSLLNKEKIFPE